MAYVNNSCNLYTIGLDLGTNSVGWSIIGKTKNNKGELEFSELIDCGSYIFQSALNETGVPLNVDRRIRRLARRQQDRSVFRRKKLTEKLIELGLLPSDWSDGFCAGDKIDSDFSIRTGFSDSPFAIRAYALDNELMPYELGRILMHLQKRRGYFSNRGAKFLKLIKHLNDSDLNESAENDNETKVMLRGISELEKSMVANNCRTVGEYVYKNPVDGKITRITRGFSWSDDKKSKVGKSKISHYAKREMLVNEFDAIRKSQNGFFKLTDNDWDEIRNLLFVQLPVGLPSKERRFSHLRYNLVSNCPMFPKKKSAAMARIESQRFRSISAVANIRINNKSLTGEQKLKIYNLIDDVNKIDKQGNIKKKEITKALGVRNIESDNGEKLTIKGNTTALRISSIIGCDAWHEMSGNCRKVNGQDDLVLKNNKTQQHALVEDLLSYVCKLGLYNRLVNYWGFSDGIDGEAYKLVTCDLENGYLKYSLKAINAMLPLMESGKFYDEHHAKNLIDIDDRVLKTCNLRNFEIPYLTNPRVEKSLYATRRVVRSIVDRMGCDPYDVRIELASDLGDSKKRRDDEMKRQLKNRDINIEADKEIRDYFSNNNSLLPSVNGADFKYIPSDLRNKYKMWKYEQNFSCAYCGIKMDFSDMINNGEVDHIVPRSSFYQSKSNSVLSCRTCNQTKGKKTPWQAFGGTDKWDRLTSHIESLSVNFNFPRNKVNRILDKSDINVTEFTERDLNETRYISSMVSDCIRKSGIKVVITKGMATSILRNYWKLSKILNSNEIDNSLVDENGILKYNDGEKIRCDHRHHAIDAFIVGMTDHKILNDIAKIRRYRDGDIKNSNISKDLESRVFSLSEDIKNQLKLKLSNIVVSHQKPKTIRGSLHEDSIYGVGYYLVNDKKFKMTRKLAMKLHPPSVMKNKEIVDGDIVRHIDDWDKIQKWLSQTNEFYTPDCFNGIQIMRRCSLIRKPVCDSVLVALGNGVFQWVFDKKINSILRDWANKHSITSKTNINKIIEAIEIDPPKTHGENGCILRHVKIASIKTANSLKKIRGNHIVKKGNNSHMEIFVNSCGESKFRIVSSIDAAERKSSNQNIYNKTPDRDWDGEWKYWNSLSINDMVRINNGEVSCDIVYRVKKMSGNRIWFTDSSCAYEDKNNTVSIINGAINFEIVHVNTLGVVSAMELPPKVLAGDIESKKAEEIIA